MQWWHVAVGAVVVGVVLVALLVRGWTINRRTSALEPVIHQQGWGWITDGAALAERWQGEPFGQGADPTVERALTGVHRGHRVTALDYAYRTRTMWRNHWMLYEVHAVQLPASMPYLELIPRSVIGQRVRGSGESVGDERFDAAFEARSTEALALEVLVPEVRAALLADTSRRYRFEGDTLLAWAYGRLGGRTVVLHLDRLVDIVDAVPDEVWQRCARNG